MYSTFTASLSQVIIKNCSSYETLLQLLQMANLYLIQKLADLVHQRITELKMAMGILLPSLETALVYRKLDGFDNICDTVDKKIVATFSALPVIEQHRFYKQQRQDNPDLVAALIQLSKISCSRECWLWCRKLKLEKEGSVSDLKYPEAIFRDITYNCKN